MSQQRLERHGIAMENASTPSLGLGSWIYILAVVLYMTLISWSKRMNFQTLLNREVTLFFGSLVALFLLTFWFAQLWISGMKKHLFEESSFLVKVIFSVLLSALLVYYSLTNALFLTLILFTITLLSLTGECLSGNEASKHHWSLTGLYTCFPLMTILYHSLVTLPDNSSGVTWFSRMVRFPIPSWVSALLLVIGLIFSFKRSKKVTENMTTSNE